MESDSRDGGARQWHKRPSEARSPGSIETPIQAKRGKSEEKEGLAQELKYEDDAMDIPIQKNIKDVIDEIRDMKDDISTQRNQIAFLLYNQVDRQRAECAHNVKGKMWVPLGEYPSSRAQNITPYCPKQPL